MRRLFANANFNFMGIRRTTYVISVAATALCILGAIFFQVKEGAWINYGVDFTGGSIMQVRVSDPTVTETQVREIAIAAVPGATVSTFGERGDFLIRTPGTESDVATEMSEAMMTALNARFGDGNVTLQREESVGAKVGGELQTSAVVAILVSFLATLIYLAIRFEWRYGVAAIVATLHDIIITLGLISLLRLEVSLTTVAAILTVLGYSLNDTIVIFDRIRERLLTMRRTDFPALLNRAINDTLPRTVMTTVTTLSVLFALYLFGGIVIRDFALILIVGVLVGTYSSIFVGSPVLYEIEKRWPHEDKGARRSSRAATTTPRPSRVG